MCKSCRLNCCGVRFDFQCKKFYHDYCSSASYIKPDLICFFNPALHRPGFRGFETWSKTIKSAISTTAPIIVTSTTENENFLDLQKIQKVCDNKITVLVPPQKNPYASTRPERNFVSDETSKIMFKNNFMFVVSERNLIDL
jgi:splicing suppressor protein 51